MNKFAIACMSGSLKAVFVQGVLSTFEEYGFEAEAFASCSASTLPASLAAVRQINNLPEEYWAEGEEIVKRPGNSMSNFVLDGIDKFSGKILSSFAGNNLKRLLIVCSYVKNQDAANQMQGNSAVTLGRQLIVKGARHISDWKENNLELHVFDTESSSKHLKLSAYNYKEVAYATTRMLHAWHIPATINNKPYLDGSYTCMIPIEPLAEIGYKNIIAIATESGKITRDFFSNETFDSSYGGSHIHWIKPDFNLKEMGVDFTKATTKAVKNVFQYGKEQGNKFINQLN
jgi:hypothetical protein